MKQMKPLRKGINNLVVVTAALAFIPTVAAAFGRTHEYIVNVVSPSGKPVKNITIETTEVIGYDQKTGTCVTADDGKCSIKFSAFAPQNTRVIVSLRRGQDTVGLRVPSALDPVTNSWLKSDDSKESTIIMEDAVQARTSKIHFLDLITVRDDDLEVAAAFTTEPAHKPNGRYFPSIELVRAFVDKKTMVVSYQVVVLDTYSHHGFYNYNQAKFMTPDGAKAVSVVQINTNVDCAEKSNMQCKYSETVGFDVNEKVMNALAAKYSEEPEGQWRFRVSSRAAHDTNRMLPYAELAAIVERVAEYVKKHQK